MPLTNRDKVRALSARDGGECATRGCPGSWLQLRDVGGLQGIMHGVKASKSRASSAHVMPGEENLHGSIGQRSAPHQAVSWLGRAPEPQRGDLGHAAQKGRPSQVASHGGKLCAISRGQVNATPAHSLTTVAILRAVSGVGGGEPSEVPAARRRLGRGVPKSASCSGGSTGGGAASS